MDVATRQLVREGDEARALRDWGVAKARYLRAATSLEEAGALLEAVVLYQAAFRQDMLDAAIPERLAAICQQLRLESDAGEWGAYCAALPRVRGQWPLRVATADVVYSQLQEDNSEALFYPEVGGLARFRQVNRDPVMLDFQHLVCARAAPFLELPAPFVLSCLAAPSLAKKIGEGAVEVFVCFEGSSSVSAISDLAQLHFDRESDSYVEACLDGGDCKRALFLLQRSFRQRPNSLRVLELLERAFIALNAPKKAAEVRIRIDRMGRPGG
jgi:hypothetical protein